MLFVIAVARSRKISVYMVQKFYTVGASTLYTDQKKISIKVRNGIIIKG